MKTREDALLARSLTSDPKKRSNSTAGFIPERSLTSVLV